MPVMQVRIIRKFADFINGVDLSRIQVGDVITVPVREGRILIAEQWAVAHDGRSDTRPASADRPRRDKKPAERRPTVLVVDDEVSMHGLLTLRFEAQGYHVESATSVDDAIVLLNARTIDAIVLDVNMPGRSGLDLLRFVRAHEKLRNLPVLILTGVTLSPDEEAIVRRNPVYIFYKQESLEEFDTYLDRLTGGVGSGNSQA